MDSPQPIISGDPSKNGWAITSFVLGIIGVIGIVALPLINIVIAIMGIIFGHMGKGSEKASLSKAGFIMSIVALVISVIFVGGVIIGFIMLKTDIHSNQPVHLQPVYTHP